MKKGLDRSSFGGKQLANMPPKEGKTIDVYFEKKYNWISDVGLMQRELRVASVSRCSTHGRMQGDKFVDRIRYKDSQPDKKKGFLTSDFHKTDEFSNTISTEQYRELLKVGSLLLLDDHGVSLSEAPSSSRSKKQSSRKRPWNCWAMPAKRSTFPRQRRRGRRR